MMLVVQVTMFLSQTHVANNPAAPAISGVNTPLLALPLTQQQYDKIVQMINQHPSRAQHTKVFIWLKLTHRLILQVIFLRLYGLWILVHLVT